MQKHEFSGKTYEEAVQNAKIELQELEENLIIKTKEEKSGLFSKKVTIEVMRRDEILDFLKEYITELTKKIGFNVNLEIKKREDAFHITIFSDNNAILIGKNGKNMEALTSVVRQAVATQTGEFVKVSIDIGDYKQRKQDKIVIIAKKIAREVGRTKIEAKLDPMNSYERRLVHSALADNKYVTTESVGEEPNRAIVIKPREN